MKGTFGKAIEVLCILLVIGTFIHLELAWSNMPDVIPVHYGFDGQIDEWGSKSRILVVPVLMLVLCVGIDIVERHPKWWSTGGIQITDRNRVDVYHAFGSMLASVKGVIAVGLSAVSAVQVNGTPQPWFLFPLFIAVLVLVVVFLIVQVYRMR